MLPTQRGSGNGDRYLEKKIEVNRQSALAIERMEIAKIKLAMNDIMEKMPNNMEIMPLIWKT